MASLVFLLAVFPPPPEAPAVAMILKTQGQVTFTQANRPLKTARAMVLLRPDDQLRTGEKSSALIVFFRGGEREQLDANTTVTISAAGCQPSGAVKRVTVTKAKLSPAQLRDLRELGRTGRQAVGTLRGEDAPVFQVSPMSETTLLTDQPTFRWPADPQAQSYRVEVRLGNQFDRGRFVWQRTSKESMLTYPLDQNKLPLGRSFTWRVEANLPEGRTKKIVESTFLTATSSEIKNLSGLTAWLKSQDPGDLLLAATLYEAHGAYEQALPLYIRLTESAPHEAHYHATLADYYEQAAQPEKAQAARQRAAELGWVPETPPMESSR